MSRRSPAFGWALLAPGAAWLVLLVAVPLAVMFLYSLSATLAYGAPLPKEWTLWHFLRLADPLYIRIFLRSFLQAGVATVLTLLLGFPLAYFIARSPVGRRERLLLLVVIPFWTNFLVRTYAWLVLLRAQGVVNSLLIGTGLISQPLSLLYNEGAVQVGLVYTLLPLMILPLYSTIDKLDHRLLEAASDLGATPARAFWNITWPLCRPGVAVGCISVFISAFGIFLVPDLMGGARSIMVGNLIQNQFLQARNWSFGAAVSLALTVLVLCLAMAVHRAGKLDEGVSR